MFGSGAGAGASDEARWSCSRASAEMPTARMSLAPKFSVEPSVALNHIALPAGIFTQKVLRTRWDYAFSARMSTSALIQFNSSDRSFSNNFRFRWEYLPGSELFVVYTDERNTRTRGFPDLRNRAFVVKANRLLRY